MDGRRASGVAALIAGMALACAGCSATALGNELVIDLKTDLLPGVEFMAVRTVITETVRADSDQPPIEVQRTITADQDFFEGVRLGEFRQLASSEVTVEVVLLDAQEQVVIARPTRVMLKGVRAVTVVISRDCRGVECPLADGDPNLTACLGGRCVDARCHPEAPEYCDLQALECSVDSECAAEHACTEPQCIERVCFFKPEDGLCDALQMCMPDSGCVEVPPTCEDGVMNGNETSVDCGGDCECTEDWAKSFGGPTQDIGISLGVDSANNLYVTGTFEGSINFGGSPLVGTDGVDEVFLASFDENGTHRWSTLIALPGSNKRAHALTVDADDNVVIAVSAEVAGTLARVLSYDQNGNFRWSAGMGGSDEFGVRFNDVATDADGNVYVAGSYSGWYGQFASNNLSSDVMYAKYDNTGAQLWANDFGSSATDAGLAIASAPDGTHYITGTFNGDLFVTALDADGTSQWGWNAGSTGLDYGRAIALSSDNRLFVAGEFEQQIDFGVGIHISNGATDGFLLNMDAATGQVQWSTQFGGTNADNVRDIYLNQAGEVLLCGDYDLNFNVDGTPFAGQGSWDGFVLAYDELSGAFNAWQNYGGSGEDRAYGLALDQTGRLYLTGNYSGSVEMAGVSLNSVGETDIFLLSTTEP